MPDIPHLVAIRATAVRAHGARTTADGVRNSWTRDALVEQRADGIGAPGGWQGATITFDIRADGDRAVLPFAHCGFRRVDEGYARTTTGWTCYLANPRQYRATGKRRPPPGRRGHAHDHLDRPRRDAVLGRLRARRRASLRAWPALA
jgi:hypothetical protein